MKRAFVITILAMTMLSLTMAAQTDKVTTIEVFPIGTLGNLCTGEDVAFDGSVTLETTTWTDANGGAHMRARQRRSDEIGTGVASGQDYKLISSGASVQFSADDGLPFTETILFQERMRGGGMIQLVVTFFHITMNAVGDTPVLIDRMFNKCVDIPPSNP